MSDLLSVVEELRGQRIVFCANPGNAGDSLIAHATYQLFAQYSIAARMVTPRHTSSLRGSVIVYGGGGNLVPEYSGAAQFLHRHGPSSDRVIVLPHTVAAHHDILRSLPSTSVVFARETTTLAALRAANLPCDVALDHDMATRLNVRGLVGPGAAWQATRNALRRRPRRGGRAALMLPKLVGKDLSSKDGTLLAYRTDIESRRNGPPAGNVDLSERYALGVDPVMAPVATALFLTHIATAGRLETDRLHVAIGASLLGVPVTLHENSYFKNRAVYAHSLSDNPFVSLVTSGGDQAEADS